MPRDPRYDILFEPVKIGPVVSTEEVEIHASSDLSAHVEGRLSDDRDIPALQLMSDTAHHAGAAANPAA
jgi:dimethylamine/trimethylamine dehydrogenase